MSDCLEKSLVAQVFNLCGLTRAGGDARPTFFSCFVGGLMAHEELS
jgi:hypothetical protein